MRNEQVFGQVSGGRTWDQRQKSSRMLRRRMDKGREAGGRDDGEQEATSPGRLHHGGKCGGGGRRVQKSVLECVCVCYSVCHTQLTFLCCGRRMQRSLQGLLKHGKTKGNVFSGIQKCESPK